MNRGNHNEPSQRDFRDYRDMPSVTNRRWRESPPGSRAYSYGYEGQGGYGDFTQGGYGEDQGPHAQSGHGRGGSHFGHGPGEHGAGGHQHRAPGSGHRGRGPRDYVRPDDSIVDELIDRMTDDEHLDATEILLMVENGAVTLTGEVPERRMKHIAEDIADAVRGVRDIENRIRVDNGVDSVGPGGAVRSGSNQRGSGFSSSGRTDDPMEEDAVRVGRAGTESEAPERHVANMQADDADKPRSSGKK